MDVLCPFLVEALEDMAHEGKTWAMALNRLGSEEEASEASTVTASSSSFDGTASASPNSRRVMLEFVMAQLSALPKHFLTHGEMTTVFLNEVRGVDGLVWWLGTA